MKQLFKIKALQSNANQHHSSPQGHLSLRSGAFIIHHSLTKAPKEF
jgi:hypothetical protein